MIINILDTEETIETEGLLDIGCTTTSISQELVDQMKLNTINLPQAITALNADGTMNRKITDLAQLNMCRKCDQVLLQLTTSVVAVV